MTLYYRLINIFVRKQFPYTNASAVQMFSDKQNKSEVSSHKFTFPFRRNMQIKKKEQVHLLDLEFSQTVG